MGLKGVWVDLPGVKVSEALEEEDLVRVKAEEPVRDQVPEGDKVATLFEEVNLLEGQNPDHAVAVVLIEGLGTEVERREE